MLRIALVSLFLSATTAFANGQTGVVFSNTNCQHYLFSLGDSHTFELTGVNLERGVIAAEAAIKKALPACKKIEFDANARQCSEVIPGNPFSMACYIESNVGFFFVTQDLLDHAHVTWNRWD